MIELLNWLAEGWPECHTPCAPSMWGCRKHWYMLPKYLRDKIWNAYEPGQEISKTPSREYVEVAQEVHEWCLRHIAARPTLFGEVL